MEKNFWGPKKFFFCDPVPVTYSNPWSRQDRRKKLFGAPKVFLHDLVSVTYLNPWSHESRQNFLGPQKFFSTILSPSHIRTPGPTKADKTWQNFLGPQKFFSTILSPSHIWTPGPTKADKTFWGPKSFFPRSCPRHIFEPLVPRKPTKHDKTFWGPKSFFHDPVPVTYSNPWSHESRQNFLVPQKFFPRSCPCHIFEPLVPQKPTKLSGAPKVLLGTHTLGQTPTSQPDLPTLIISYFHLNFPEVQFRIPKLKLRPPKYYNFTRMVIKSYRSTTRSAGCLSTLTLDDLWTLGTQKRPGLTMKWWISV